MKPLFDLWSITFKPEWLMTTGRNGRKDDIAVARRALHALAAVVFSICDVLSAPWT
jgi:hypothetical protein